MMANGTFGGGPPVVPYFLGPLSLSRAWPAALPAFKFRLILDESFSFGALGPTGRGVTEMFEIPISQVRGRARRARQSTAPTTPFDA